MAQNIEIKHSAVPGKVPTTSSLHLGQLAVNSWDGKVYFEKFANTNDEVLELVSNKFTGSIAMSGSMVLDGALQLQPTTDPDPTGANLTDTFLFVSQSNTALGYDMYHRQDGNLVKWKWIESLMNTGVLYGGVLSYSGSYFYVSSGSGIIVDHNATTSSEVSPIISYVNWNNITASIINTGSQNTFIYIDATGSVGQQTSFFTPQQYHEIIPIGRVSHYGTPGSTVTGVSNNMVTSYDQIGQANEFIRAFGPLKINGLGISAQTGSLRISISSGTAYNLGGFYQYNPELPSIYNSNAAATASIVRIYRSGSNYLFDNDGGAYYTTVDPANWDDGSGTLQPISNNNWTIQRVFTNPVSGRAHIYYSQTSPYATLATALANLSTEAFTESEVTKNSYVFSGFIIAKSNTTDLANAENSIVQGGLFRSISGGGAGGGGGASALTDLSDVSISLPSDGQALIYNTGLWVNGTPLNSTSASYAATASYANNFTVAGTLTAQTIVAQTITSSTEFITGSTIFGSLSSNTHQFTGSVSISGSLTVNGTSNITASNIQGGGSSSFAFWNTNNTLTGSNIYRVGTNNTVGSTLNDGYIFQIVGSLKQKGNEPPNDGGAVILNSSGNAGSLLVQSSTGNIYAGRIGTSYLANGTDVGIVGTSTLYIGTNSTILALGSNRVANNIILGNFAGSTITINGNTTLTGSLNVSGSSHTITGSLNAAVITGSLFGTASWALNAITASYVLNAISSSFASTASYVNPLVQNVIVTGSQIIQGTTTAGAPFPNFGYVGVLELKSSNQNALSVYGLKLNNTNTGNAYIGISADNASAYSMFDQSIIHKANGHIFYNNSDTNLLSIFPSTGNVSINSSTDAGFKLNVNGTSRFTNNMIVSGAATINGSAIVYRVEKNQADQSNPLQLYVAYNHIDPRIEFWGGTGAKLYYNTSTLALYPNTASAIDLGTSTLGFGNVYSNTITTNTSSFFAVVSGSVGIGKTTPNAKFDVSGSAIISGSLTVTQGITGSLFGTSSWALNTLTSSYVLNAISASFATTASYALNTVQPTSGKVIYVDASSPNATNTRGSLSKYNLTYPFTTIQAAVNAAASGDSIWVYPGTYNESVLVGPSGSVVLNFILYSGVTINGGASYAMSVGTPGVYCSANIEMMSNTIIKNTGNASDPSGSAVLLKGNNSGISITGVGNPIARGYGAAIDYTNDSNPLILSTNSYCLYNMGSSDFNVEKISGVVLYSTNSIPIYNSYGSMVYENCVIYAPNNYGISGIPNDSFTNCLIVSGKSCYYNTNSHFAHFVNCNLYSTNEYGVYTTNNIGGRVVINNCRINSYSQSLFLSSNNTNKTIYEISNNVMGSRNLSSTNIVTISDTNANSVGVFSNNVVNKSITIPSTVTEFNTYISNDVSGSIPYIIIA